MSVHNNTSAEANLNRLLQTMTGELPREQTEQDNRVNQVALDNLPQAQVAEGHCQHRARRGTDLEQERTPQFTTPAEVLEVTYEDVSDAEDITEARLRLSQGFTKKLTKKDPGFETGQASRMQRIRDRLRKPEKRDEVAEDRKARYDLIKKILLTARSDQNATEKLENIGYKYRTKRVADLSIGAVVDKVVIIEKGGLEAKAARYLLKNIKNEEAVRRDFIQIEAGQRQQIASRFGAYPTWNPLA